MISCQASTAHPRSRGENLFATFPLVLRAGSSPLTRGKQDAEPRAVCRRRLIPAHAGKTVGDELPGQIMWAHPRSRGENTAKCPTRTWPPGSSPLTRGKPHEPHNPPLRRRLIPAHAGKTWSRISRLRRSAAHPRSRGENPACASVFMSRGGSSPLTRGKQPDSDRRLLVGRLIPAHAGKTTCPL